MPSKNRAHRPKPQNVCAEGHICQIRTLNRLFIFATDWVRARTDLDQRIEPLRRLGSQAATSEPAIAAATRPNAILK